MFTSPANFGKMAVSGLLLSLSTTALSSAAFAQENDSATAAPGPIEISGNVALTSDYRFRGIGFSDGDIAVQGGIDLSHESGFYVGTWASSIEDSPTYGHTELDIYGGWSGDIASGLNLDVGLLYYAYPNGKVGPSEYFEPYAKLSGSLGPAELTVGAAYAPKQQAIGSNDNIYVFTDLGVGIPNTPITLNGHFGYNNGSLSAVSLDGDYIDYSIGADYAITSKLTGSLKFVGTDRDTPKFKGFNDDAVVFTLGYSF
ncbi:hypothetical protein LPB140_00670 [Sphingorhabdus lutea]|uniref:Porin n=1 Tax=Sphingorhabdus lutea TaxID=1913578 RepID=A0A1L3JE68_9SPHN|nr:TorF family putative porin [Sphingorhabdus lutea]APG63427.1 hypothetical protein LPB140_00670 [Sphingorhabdus lutea]